MANVNARNLALEKILSSLKVDMGCILFVEESGGYVLKLARGSEEVEAETKRGIPRSRITAVVADWAEKNNRRVLPVIFQLENPKGARHSFRWVHVDPTTLKPKAPLVEEHFTPI